MRSEGKQRQPSEGNPGKEKSGGQAVSKEREKKSLARRIIHPETRRRAPRKRAESMNPQANVAEKQHLAPERKEKRSD